MTEDVLYWRIKDEQTGKWSYKKATLAEEDGVLKWEQCLTVLKYQGE